MRNQCKAVWALTAPPNCLSEWLDGSSLACAKYQKSKLHLTMLYIKYDYVSCGRYRSQRQTHRVITCSALHRYEASSDIIFRFCDKTSENGQFSWVSALSSVLFPASTGSCFQCESFVRPQYTTCSRRQHRHSCTMKRYWTSKMHGKQAKVLNWLDTIIQCKCVWFQLLTT